MFTKRGELIWEPSDTSRHDKLACIFHQQRYANSECWCSRIFYTFPFETKNIKSSLLTASFFAAQVWHLMISVSTCVFSRSSPFPHTHPSIYANRAWVGFGVCAARAPKSLSAGTLIGNRSGPADRHTMDPVRWNAQSSNQWRANSCCSHGVGYFDSHRRSPVCLIDWIGRRRRP